MKTDIPGHWKSQAKLLNSLCLRERPHSKRSLLHTRHLVLSFILSAITYGKLIDNVKAHNQYLRILTTTILYALISCQALTKLRERERERENML